MTKIGDLNHELDNIEVVTNGLLGAIPIQQEPLFLCIGTDRSTGDSYGPLVGTFLETRLPALEVFGTLKNPVHAVNLEDTVREIQTNYPHYFLVAIDATMSNSQDVGKLLFKKEGLRPGSLFKRDLPMVGDVSISGVVNIFSPFGLNLQILQGTRLSNVMDLAEQTFKGIRLFTLKRERERNDQKKSIISSR